MKRRLDCAWCGRALPAGCRIDKQYCDQRCVELAYYDRHPDKRARKLAKLRGTGTTAALRTRRPESAPDLVARVEMAHASSRQELGAVRERLAQVEALLRSQSRSSKEQELPQRPVQDAATVRKVAELQAALQDEKNRADDAAREQARLAHKIEELDQQLRERNRGKDDPTRELILARDAARKAEQKSRELEAALQQAQTAAARPVSVGQDSTHIAFLQAARKSIADLEAKLKAATQRASQAEQAAEAADTQVAELSQAVTNWQTYSEQQAQKLSEAQNALRAADQQATNTQMQSHAASSARLPWTHPAPNNAHHYIPQWEALGDKGLKHIDQLAEVALTEVPGQLWKGGDRKLAQEMRAWLDAPSRLLMPLSQQIVLRIICTPPPERRSQKQKEVLGEAALADAIQFLCRQHPDIAHELEQEVAQENYELLAGELVIACAEHRLKQYF